MRSDFLNNHKCGGYHCRVGGFYLDPKKPVNVAIISHAHADHAVAGSQVVYCTAPTRSMMEKRYGKSAAAIFLVKAYGEPFDLDGVKISFLPAGHMLGSSQVLMEHEGIRYLYTGDFKLQPDTSCEPFEQVKADMIITETTFARPFQLHPSPGEEMEKLNAVGERNIIVGAYALGKAQRLSSLLDRYCPGKKVVVHPDIALFHNVYESFGIQLGSWEHYRRDVLKEEKNIVYLVPPKVFARYRNNATFARAFASGWDHLAKGDIALKISDHADWNDLIQVIKESGARQVRTVHGSGKELTEYLSATGIVVSGLGW